jgi:hypothetical protein
LGWSREGYFGELPGRSGTPSGFGTRAILNGVNPSVVAELMGHNSLEMVSKVYVHLADEHAHLKAAVKKINPSSTPLPAPSGPVRKRALPVNPKKSGRKPKGLGDSDVKS